MQTHSCTLPCRLLSAVCTCSKKVLWVSADITETGSVQWELVLCNLACFAIVFAVLYKGIQSLGKVSKVF